MTSERKLTEEQVKAIKAALSAPCKCCGHEASYRELGDKFGVSGVTIFNINRRKSWKHVE